MPYFLVSLYDCWQYVKYSSRALRYLGRLGSLIAMHIPSQLDLNRRVILTCSSVASFLDFQTNSHTAMTEARPIPASSTTKIPPTLAMLREAAFPLSDFS